jgi:hypothetical protein
MMDASKEKIKGLYSLTKDFVRYVRVCDRWIPKYSVYPDWRVVEDNEAVSARF